MSELRLGESLGSLLRQVPPDDGEHLLCGRGTVQPDNGALDRDVLVGELLALHRQAQHTSHLDEPGLAGLATLRPCEERDASARLVTVPDRRGMRRPGFQILQRMVGARARIHKCLPGSVVLTPKESKE